MLLPRRRVNSTTRPTSTYLVLEWFIPRLTAPHQITYTLIVSTVARVIGLYSGYIAIIMPNLPPLFPEALARSQSQQQSVQTNNLASHDNDRQPQKSDVQPACQGPMHLKRENPFEPNQHPKRLKQSQNNVELNYTAGKSECYSSDDSDSGMDFFEDEIDATRVHTASTPSVATTASSSALHLELASPSLTHLPTHLSPSDFKLRGAGSVTNKMFGFHDLAERRKECHTELACIANELTLLEVHASRKYNSTNILHVLMDVQC